MKSEQRRIVARWIGRAGFGAICGLSSAAAMAAPSVEFVEGSPVTPIGRSMVQDFSVYGMYAAADGVVKSVILCLLLASLVTWTICIAKAVELVGQRRRLGAAFGRLTKASDLNAIGDLGCIAVQDMIRHAEDEILESGIDDVAAADGIKDRVALRLTRVEAGTARRIGKFVGVLAIIGSSATFVGLFGTVWGVMNSFIGVAEANTTNLAVVAPGIAEALLATAAGLVAAVPAVVIYNVFARAIAAYRGELGDAAAMILCLAGREIDRRAAAGVR